MDADDALCPFAAKNGVLCACLRTIVQNITKNTWNASSQNAKSNPILNPAERTIMPVCLLTPFLARAILGEAGCPRSNKCVWSFQLNGGQCCVLCMVRRICHIHPFLSFFSDPQLAHAPHLGAHLQAPCPPHCQWLGTSVTQPAPLALCWNGRSPATPSR